MALMEGVVFAWQVSRHLGEHRGEGAAVLLQERAAPAHPQDGAQRQPQQRCQIPGPVR